MGRAEIGRALSLSTQAVSNIIAELSDDGLLIERGHLAVGRGLPAKQYALNPKGGYAFGIEIRPDALLAALLDMEGNPVMMKRVAMTKTDPETIVVQIKSLYLEALADEAGAGGRMLGAGIVMPGPFGATGISGHGTDLADWNDIDPATYFSQALDLPVEVSNDANAAAMAERLNGAAQGLSNYAYLYFGTGLGLGLVSDGALVQGAFGNAGEIGHIPMPGINGNLESRLSRMSLQQHLSSADKHADDIDTLAMLFESRDKDLHAWLKPACEALAYAVAVVENLFDPEAIILGGAMPDALLEYFVDQTSLPDQSVSNRPNAQHPRLQSGASGRMTATLGAAALVLNRTLSPHIAHAH
ncbi:MAG: ROK family transcriptional regulator [Boseongicola sp.]|nr:ROK family transcriptional regulator [Boseongicola sp.]NNL17105.1 ROK family transcriptional regulator [Boseongicola sp.]